MVLRRPARQQMLAATVFVSDLLVVAAPAGANNASSAHRSVCTAPRAATASCPAEVIIDRSGAPLVTSGAAGFTPTDLQLAYALPAPTAGGGQTVAIVAAYDDPNPRRTSVCTAPSSASAVDNRQRLLPQGNQKGKTNPRADSSWAQEISLDLDMVSAGCPNCKIVLVEAASNSYADLGTGVDQAALLGASAISNSYGGPEFSTETSIRYDGHYDHAGVATTASAGDAGYAVHIHFGCQQIDS